MIRAAILVAACDVAMFLALLVSPGMTDLIRLLVAATLLPLLVIVALLAILAGRDRQRDITVTAEAARLKAAVRRRRDRQAAALLDGIDGHPRDGQDGGEFW